MQTDINKKLSKKKTVSEKRRFFLISKEINKIPFKKTRVIYFIFF